MSGEVSRKLREALEKIDRPGTFCTSGSVPVVLPGLEVEGLGPVGLPLTATQAKELKKHCEQAPYGKGEQTLVDTQVRRVWRMTPDRFTLTNPEWPAYLKILVATVQQELGLEKQKLESHLYDLLLYERGSFFLPHRDGEKLDRMVATLVVVLPSSFQGGELVVRHEGQEQSVDFSTDDDTRFHMHYAAFYADCEHEIRPLKSGYRLSLVYNLTLAKSKKKSITAPRTSEHVDRVSRILHDWTQADAPHKLVVTLGHQYTQDGLTWDTLKGVDRAQATVLREAAQQAGCRACLALLTFWESGEGRYAGGGYDYDYRDRRRRRYWEDDDDDDEAGEYEMGEVFETSLTAEHVRDADGSLLTTAPMDVERDELLDPDALTQVEPEEDFEGYTGNAGMTLDRWYRHAAVLLWPESRHFDVLCDCGVTNVVPAFKQMVSRWKKARGDEAAALKSQCVQFAGSIIARWPEREYAYSYRVRDDEGAENLLPVLARLNDRGLIAAYIGGVLVKDASADPGRQLPRLCAKYGWQTFHPELTTLFASTTTSTLPRHIGLLEQFCLAAPSKTEGRAELCRELAAKIVSALEAIDAAQASRDWRARELNRADMLAGLAKSLIATEQDELLVRVVAHALSQPKHYSLKAHVAALSQLQPWLDKHLNRNCAPLSQWVAAGCEQLESLTAQAPQEPTDFRREANVACKCADCRELNQFLKDPQAEVHRFRVRQDRRGHVAEVIRKHGCDVDCTTERTGSPHSLVCTKNTASYQAALEEYHQNQADLKVLRALEASLPEPAAK